MIDKIHPQNMFSERKGWYFLTPQGLIRYLLTEYKSLYLDH